MTLRQYSEEDLEKSITLLQGDECQSSRVLAEECRLELIRRKLPPLEELFPEGGYIKEDGTLVPYKD
jgi:hypothetical protein